MNRPLQNGALRASERFLKTELAVREFSYLPKPTKTELRYLQECRDTLAIVQRAIVDAELNPECSKFSHCDRACVTREIVDVSTDPTWWPILCVETVTGPLGSVTSVVNHQYKTFEQRRSELDAILAFDTRPSLAQGAGQRAAAGKSKTKRAR